MNRLVLAVSLAVGAALFLPKVGFAQSNESSIRYDQVNEKEIRKLYNAFEDAWNRHDTDAMADMWTIDGDHQEPDGRAADGREEIRALFRKEHETMMKTSVLDLSIQDVWFITADVALVDGTYSAAGITSPDGKELPARGGHLTAVILKERDQWLIAASRLMIPLPLPWKPE